MKKLSISLLENSGVDVSIADFRALRIRKINSSAKVSSIRSGKFFVSKEKRQAMFVNQVKRNPAASAKMVSHAKLIKFSPEDVRVLKICG
jgi:hypothetical protein